MTNEDVLSTLNPTAAGLARAFLAAHPDAVLTSGRRDIADQAEAMAANVVLNRNWVRETYLSSPLSVACQNHVNLCGPVLTQEDLANGFRAVMLLAEPDELRRLSWHIAQAGQLADAFDAKPVPGHEQENTARALVATAVASGAHGKVLTEEGGIRKLHVQIA